MITEEKQWTEEALAEMPYEAPPAKELSPIRVLILVVVLAGIAFGGYQLWKNSTAAAGARSTANPVFAPYVDVTLTPTYPFQSPASNPVANAYLGFIVSRPSAPCTASWGGYYTLDQAGERLDLDSRIAELRSQGGTAMVAFGGASGSEPAVQCSDVKSLESEYLAPITRYHSSTIDLDVEGAGLGDVAADVRRGRAIAAVQKQLAQQGKHLAVWLTLPSQPTGLTEDGIRAARALLRAHVALSGINVMAMDFGASQAASTSMSAMVREALEAAHGQVQALWRSVGLHSTPGQAWARLGATVMIGVNDDNGERFTIRDARWLASFANHVGLARVSDWSLNRDSECGGAYPEVGVLSNTCSGVSQHALQFTRIFSKLRGTRTAHPVTAVTSTAAPRRVPVDHQATSPYPIWQATAAYDTGYLVVWHRRIYQARWWSQGTAPDAATNGATPTPWLLIGPVPKGARDPKPVLLARGHYRPWKSTKVYRGAQRVTYHGLPFQARWYTHGDRPSTSLPADVSQPWKPLFTAAGEPTDGQTGGGN